MSCRAFALFLCAVCALTPLDPRAAMARRPTTPTTPRGTQGIDNDKRIDINNISMFVTNTGSFAWDKAGGVSGLEFPKGSGNTAVFAGGLWLGAHVGGETRVTLSEYSDEYGPGSMVGGLQDIPGRPEYKVYKLLRNYSSTAQRDADVADYIAGAVPYGAPVVSVQLDGSLNIAGDEMLWSVYNDADPSLHTNQAGRTPPLGIEVQQTTFAYAQPGPLNNTVFLRYKILNKGSQLLQDMYVALWADPDVGGATDDLVGCDITRALGKAYNGYSIDSEYGSAAPAVGFDLLRGPTDPATTHTLGLSSFTKYINGSDPQSAVASYNGMLGLDGTGLPFVDPTTGLPTKYMVSGNPLTGTGWIDSNPTDQRLRLSSGPLTLAPGQSIEVTYALVIGQGINHLSSLSKLDCYDTAVQAFFDRGFALPYPAEPSCPEFQNCPRTSTDWSSQCAQGGGEFTPQQLAELARRVDAGSQLFDWGTDPVGGLCSALSAAGAQSPRGYARREFAALLSSMAASQPAILPSTLNRTYLDPGTPISCNGLSAHNLAELTARAAPTLAGASYLDLIPTNPPPLGGVNVLGPLFGGGAGTMSQFVGSRLNPATDPDSFMTVELRFDHTQTQKAYRWMRLETTQGVTFPGGRGYVYGGFRDVPFTCWDVTHNVQLDVGFLERTLAADDGTILPASMQPASFDSTWDVDDSPDGGHEYLFVFHRNYDGAPKAAIAFDSAPSSRILPGLYYLAARKLSPSSVIDDGDAFRFEWGVPFGPSVDAILYHLESMPLSDPAVIQSYLDISLCLYAINNGSGIGPVCGGPTATLVSLVSADADPDRVRLVWYSAAAVIAHVERRPDNGTWTVLGDRTPDGRGMIVYEDTDVTAGHHYDYRLRVARSGADQILGEISIDVPSSAELSLSGFIPNPAHGDLSLAFTLASKAPATLTVFDVAGRRRLALDVGSMGPGRHVLPLRDRARLTNGVYLIHLSQGGRTEIRKAMVLN